MLSQLAELPKTRAEIAASRTSSASSRRPWQAIAGRLAWGARTPPGRAQQGDHLGRVRGLDRGLGSWPAVRRRAAEAVSAARRPARAPALPRALPRPSRIGAVRAVIHPDDRALYDEAARGLELLAPVEGGPSRQESVRLGLESLARRAAGAGPDPRRRPAAGRCGADRPGARWPRAPPAVLPALPVTDTLKRVAAGRVLGTVERAGLSRAQTPQGFAYRGDPDAHRAAAGAGLTDDVAVAEAAGLRSRRSRATRPISRSPSPPTSRAPSVLLAGRLRPRTGLGFDVHRLGPGDGARADGRPAARPVPA